MLRQILLVSKERAMFSGDIKFNSIPWSHTNFTNFLIMLCLVVFVVYWYISEPIIILPTTRDMKNFQTQIESKSNELLFYENFGEIEI